jgi:peptide-methionine (S)-S-oxide reductase
LRRNVSIIAIGAAVAAQTGKHGRKWALRAGQVKAVTFAPLLPIFSAAKYRRLAMEKALFGAGCFWGVEHFFREVPGVTSAVSGYAGGQVDNPTYKQVCTDRTGHAEVVEVTFDPAKVSYATLVDLFFKMHDPTTLNRQGPDVGTQYRSAIFANSPEQERVARERLDAAAKSGRYKRPVVTTIEPAAKFWPAEDYHQRYFEKHGGSCHVSYAEVANT